MLQHWQIRELAISMINRLTTTSGIFFVFAVFACVAHGQNNLGNGIEADLVKLLGSCTTSRDLTVAKTSAQALRELTASNSDEIQKLAEQELEAFREKAKTWASGLNQTKGVTTANQSPPFDKGPLTLTYLTFEDLEVNASELVFIGELERLQTLAFANVSGLRDQDLVFLNGLNNLKSLTIESTAITGSGLKKVSLPNLQVLFLTKSNIDDAGIAGFVQGSFPVLSDVILNRTRVTDSSIRLLGSLPNLERCRFPETAITEEGAKDLDYLIKQRKKIEKRSQATSGAFRKPDN